MDHTLALDGVQVDEKVLFERLYRNYYHSIYVYLCRMVDDQKLAGDLAQDTFIKAYGALHRLAEGSNVRAWLYRIATNTALDRLRRQSLISWLPLFDRDTHPAVGHPAHESLESVAVQQSFRELPARYRAPLVLYSCHGLSTQEIAEILQISKGAVKTRLFRAREMFRRAYASEEG
jgi:RNA polymerase sigma-70 factor (ECF subfamily)